MKLKLWLLAIVIFTGMISVNAWRYYVMPTAHAQENENESDDNNEYRNISTPTPTSIAQTSTPIQTVQTTPIPAASSDAALSQTPTPAATQTPSSWPWYIARAAGITSLILLALLVLMGLVITTGVVYRLMGPIPAWTYHRLIGIALVISVAIHLISLMFDHFMSFSIGQILIPFTSTYRSLYVGFGTISLYLFLVVLITSLWFIKQFKSWRLLHYLSFLMFVLVLIHGYFTGTDSASTWVKLLYLLIFVLVVVMVYIRVRMSGGNTNPTD